MSIPNQPIGLTNFSGSVNRCPPNPNAIRAIVFSKDNLAVTNGANTEIQISLSSFYIPVNDEVRLSFTLPGKPNNINPSLISKLDLGGIGGTAEEVKFIALLPQYNIGAGSTGDNSIYLEWAPSKMIDQGTLKEVSPIQLDDNTSFQFYQINQLEFSWGGHLNYEGDGKGSLYAATNGGLLEWNGSKLQLWHTLNSESPSDFMSSIAVDTSNTLWIGTNNGLAKFNSASTNSFLLKYDTRHGMSSDLINDVKIFGNNKLAVATDKGLTITDTQGSAFNVYNIYNSPFLKHNNITKLNVNSDSSLIFAGTTGGVYVFDTIANKFVKYPLNSTTITGWNAPNSVNAITSHGGNIYIGTTGGIVTFPYSGVTGATGYPMIGITATGITAGTGSIYSNNVSSLRVIDGEIYAGHYEDGAISYSSDGITWNTTLVDGASNSKISDVIVDSMSGTIYTGNALDSGIYKSLFGDSDTVPGLNDTTDILLSVPGMTSSLSGNYTVDTSKLYSINQSLWFLFSKDMSPNTSFTGSTHLYKGIDGSGSLIDGNWYLDFTGKIASFVPHDPFERASGYNLTSAVGSTASDGSYVSSGLNIGFYTEDIDPEIGWLSLGKMLVLSGSNIKYTESIYLRNPQAQDVNIIALIGK